jgi:hypothetical protein
MPDLVDGAAWPVRGELGQGFGHSLLGVLVASLPAGLVLTRLVRRIAPRDLITRLDEGAPASPHRLRAPLSVFIGALSHLAFDLITPDNLVLFWPWVPGEPPFPSWWSHAWSAIPIPGYREPYPVAPHTVAWCVLTLLGAFLFVRCVRGRR